MIVKVRTAVETVNIVFSSSKNAFPIERKIIQYTKLSIKLHHCTLTVIKTQVFTLLDFLACVSIHCTDQKQHPNLDFLAKSADNTLQTCVDMASEYLHVYNTGAGVKNQVFCSLHQCKCVGYTMFLITFVLSNNFF